MVHIGNDWDEVLSGEFESDYYRVLREKLITEYASSTVYPPKEDIFNALKICSYSDVKVVILGQDPYHEPGEAHGLAFSVKKGVALPPSLKNIYKEIESDMGRPALPLRLSQADSEKGEGDLTCWAKQGVLLLNASLTVRAHEAQSHKALGWQTLTDNIIKKLNERDEPIVYILWGNSAKAKLPLITNPNHFVILGAHPSPLAASRGFFGGKYFSKANKFLELFGKEKIDW